jgi:hypothetical protein
MLKLEYRAQGSSEDRPITPLIGRIADYLNEWRDANFGADGDIVKRLKVGLGRIADRAEN